ncbi:NACHT domain-containing protein [Streptomyces natalensis]|uniref:NACHT domain-containing protein n=1 Tax=Streptomyces natalensis TaxID=68242 RepID=UPI0007C48071|nr:NACHT domain-containing protein [Streptomyces natalensis]
MRAIRESETGEHADVQEAQRGHFAHNQMSGTVYGPVIQAGTISGPVTVMDCSGAVLRDPAAEAAEQLAQAVGARWRREEEQRQIQDPFPLPVRWQPAPEDLTDHWANICRAPAGVTPGPLPLAGQLDGVVDLYRRLPSGRLLVIGRAGSGKTILTLRFVLDLLRTRTTADAVPVIFSLGSWNPETTVLRDWLTGQLVRDYPGLAATAPGGSTLAASLVEADRILPVLDGFDEIAEGLHRDALEKLNATTLPLVLTSRRAEYAYAVAQADVLTSAAGIELTDLTLTDLESYLPRTTRKAASNGTRATATAWDPVLNELRDHPQSRVSVSLAAVLKIPLMVALARTIYSDNPDHDPSALLNADQFSTPEAIEDHLLDNFVATVYRRHLNNGHHRRWNPERVQHWLGYLAEHLSQLGTRDLAWWQLGNTTRRSSRVLVVALVSGLAVGIVFGLVVGCVNWLAVGFMFGLTDGLVSGLAAALAGGLAFGLLHRFGVELGSGEAALEPSRVRMRIIGGMRRVREKFMFRLMAGLGGGFGIGFVGWFGYELLNGLKSGLVNGLMVSLVNGLVYGLLSGLAFGLLAGLEAPIDIRTAVSPSDLLDTNRTTVIFELLAWGLVFGLGVGIVIGLWGEFVQGLVLGLHSGLVSGLANGLAFGLVGGLGGGLGYALSATAWGRWVVLSRMWLPLTGRLPWAVIAFLDDAYQRGVLRQAGAVYQFRHARLQDHLAHAFQAHMDARPNSLAPPRRSNPPTSPNPHHEQAKLF